jgi:hypothetical protein
MSIA